MRERQRTMVRLYSRLRVMSTLGIVPPGPCHFPLIGWAEIANLVLPLMERDLYGKVPAGSVTAPDLVRALVVGGTAEGNQVRLKLKAGTTAKTVTYLQEKSWDQMRLLRGKNGIAALTFCEVPLVAE